MKGLIVAIQFLTRLPTPRLAVSNEEFAASICWFPAVGLIVGALVCAATVLGTQVDPWVGALAGLALWVSVTGALHLDGLGDVADACGAAHKDRERLLAVLADPHVGSFAVVSIGLQLAAKLVLLRVLLDAVPPVTVVFVPFAARIGPLAWTRWLPPLHEGLAARFRPAMRNTDLAIWGILLLAASFLTPALLAAFALIALWGWWLGRKLGGISGDGHGAGIELVETGLLVTIIAVARLA
jgi:adenosylcobinamide-GDP ribazoletransferase